MEKLRRGIAPAILEKGQVDFSLNRWSMIKRLAMAFLVLVTHSAWAENTVVDFNRITLPTDLVAAISDIEDDIATSSPSQRSQAIAITSESDTSSSESDIIGSESTLPAADSTPSVAATPATESINADKEADPAIEGQPAQDRVAKFNTEVPAIEPESSTLIAAVDSTDQATAGSDVPASEIVPPKTAQQLTQKQDDRINEDEIILTWATAWSNNDVEQYLSFYSDDFVPEDPSLDRPHWEQLRRKRLKNQEIRIIVSNAEVYRADNEITEIRFTQRYTSKNYRDRVIKSIEMRETPDGWKFISERTLETLPFE